MRIGFEAKRATHNFRGLGNYSRGLIEGLIEYAPEAEILLYTPPIKDPRGNKWIQNLADKVQLRTPHSYIGSKLPALWRSFLLSDDLSKDRLDIFHGLSHEIPYRLKGEFKFKKIVTMHDLIFMRYPEFFPLIDRLVYKQKFKYACENSDLVIAICEQTKTDLVEMLGVDEKKIVVHYQSCDPLFTKVLPELDIIKLKEKYQIHKPFILNVGAFEERKNQLGLLNAFAQISKRTDCDLIFIGQGKKYKEQVMTRASELNLLHRVSFLHSITHSELPAFYQAAKVFCFPSLFEGFGIPIIESLFSKTPVITSFGSCFPESAGPNSYYIDPLSESSIANGLITVLSDELLQNEMILKGSEFVKRFEVKETTDRLMDIYRQVLA